jgi:glycosyltransferase involved in cell wall biosynthesis
VTVVHLISSAGYYGAENMLITLVRALRTLGIRSVIAAFRNAQNPNLEIAMRAAGESFGTEIISCKGRLDVSAVHQIRWHIERHRADLVHTHGYKADLYGYLATTRSTRPIAATCHNWTNDTKRVQFYASLDRWILRHFAVVTAVSSSVGTALERAGIASQKIRVIPNGIDLDRFAAAPSDALPMLRRNATVIGMAGRLVSQKGFHDVIAAAPAILARFPETQFLIAGDGPQRPLLEQAARDTGVAHAFVFAGARSDMHRLYRAMDIFVLPSLNEGMPMTVLEAMAAGRTVVATRVGAIPELVGDGESGRLFAPGDRAALTAVLLDLLSDPDTRARMGAAGYSRVSRDYSSLAMARQYVSLYEQLLRERHAA